MITEALKDIKEAEEKAEKLKSDAKLKAKEIVRTYQAAAVDEYKKIIEEANLEAKIIIDEYIKKAEFQAKPLKDIGEKNIKEIHMISEDKISKAVNVIVERIVNYNGHC